MINLKANDGAEKWLTGWACDHFGGELVDKAAWRGSEFGLK